MIKKITPLYILCLLLLMTVSSCQLDTARPIRNVRFDGNLLNRLQMAPDSLCSCNNYSLGESGRKLGLMNLEQVLVEFDNNLTNEQRQDLVKEYSFVKSLSYSVQTNSTTLYTLNLNEGFNCNQVEYILSVLAEDPEIVYTAPYFVAGAEGVSSAVGLSNELLITLEEGVGQAALDEVLNVEGAEVVDALGNNTYLVKVNKSTKRNTLELAKFLGAKKGIAHAEPDFVIAL